MIAYVGENDSGRPGVLQFYGLFPTREKENMVRDIVRKQKQGGRSKWSYWLCKEGCKKLRCVCDNQDIYVFCLTVVDRHRRGGGHGLLTTPTHRTVQASK